MQAKAKHVGELVGGEAEQAQIAGTFVELTDGEIATQKLRQDSTCCKE